MNKTALIRLCSVLLMGCVLCFSSCAEVKAVKASPTAAAQNSSQSDDVTSYAAALPGAARETTPVDSDSEAYTCYMGSDSRVFTVLKLYDDSSFRLTPNIASSNIPNELFGTYVINGDKLQLVFEGTNLVGDKTTDLSALNASIIIDNDTLVIMKDETSLPRFGFYPEDNIVLTQSAKKQN